MVRTQNPAPSLTSVHLLVSLEGDPAQLETLITEDPVFKALCAAKGVKIIRSTLVPPTEEEMGMNRLFELIGRMETLVQQNTGTAQRPFEPVPTTAGRLEDNAPVRKRLKSYFKAHPEVSQGQFADRIKLGRSTVSAFLNGRDLAPYSLEKIARELKD